MITDDRLKKAFDILQKASDERQLVKDRVEQLKSTLDFVLSEIEKFENVVYCKQAAALRLGNGVLQLLAGSHLHGGKILSQDRFYNKPSPAASDVLGRTSNGRKEWKYRNGKSISG